MKGDGARALVRRSIRDAAFVLRCSTGALVVPAAASLAAALGATTASCGVETYRERPPARDLALRAVVEAEGAAVELVPRQDGGAPLSLARAVLVDADHVRHVRLLDAADGRRVLVLEVDDVGVARLAALTERAEGTRIAVVAGGRVVAAPTLRGRLDAHELVIALPAARVDEAFDQVGR